MRVLARHRRRNGKNGDCLTPACGAHFHRLALLESPALRRTDTLSPRHTDGLGLLHTKTLFLHDRHYFPFKFRVFPPPL